MSSLPPSRTLKRIAPYVAARSQLSRRQVEYAISQGRLLMNGNLVTNFALEAHVLEGAHWVLDGISLGKKQPEEKLWGYIKAKKELVTWHDPQGRPTVFQRARQWIPAGPLWSVGRLDWDSEGLLLLTNVSDLAHSLETQPWPRQYWVWVQGTIKSSDLDGLRKGWEHHGIAYSPWEIYPLPLKTVKELARPMGSREIFSWANAEGRHYTALCITLTQGKNREIRNTLGECGLKIVRLVRVSYGPVEWRNAEFGNIFSVSAPEVQRILRHSRFEKNSKNLKTIK